MAARRREVVRSEVSVTPERVKPFEKTGTSGTSVFGGVPQVKETDAQLVGSLKWKNFSEILVNTAIVGASVRFYLNLISQAQWDTKPADETPVAKEYADLAKDIINDMETPWNRVVKRMAMYRLNGYSAQEWTAKRRVDGKIGFQDIEPRPVHTITEWDCDTSGDVKGLVQQSPWDYSLIYLPRAKLVYVVDDSISDSPEGCGLLRHIYPHSKLLKDYELMESRGFETDLRGIPLLRIPFLILDQMVKNNDISEAEKKTIIDAMKGFIDNHIRGQSSGIMLDSAVYTSADASKSPSGQKHWDAEILKGEGGLFADLDKTINRKLHDIARLLGTEHMLMGETSAGSYAQAKIKMQGFYLNVDGALEDIKNQSEKDVIGALWRLNGWPDEMKPDLTYEKVRFKDVEQITQALANMAQAGSMLEVNDPAIDEVRDMLGLSRPNTMAWEADAMLVPRPSHQSPEEPILDGGEPA